jgi:hypothetical protein
VLRPLEPGGPPSLWTPFWSRSSRRRSRSARS